MDEFSKKSSNSSNLTPKVSIIIPNYNHSRYLRKRIDTVLSQTYQNFEVIIMDDCSKDNSREIIDSYRNHPKISQIIFNDINSGNTFAQWNKGIAIARGQYIWIAESDDYAADTLLEKTVKILEEYNNVGFAYVQSNHIDEWDNIITPDYGDEVWERDFVRYGKDLIFEYFGSGGNIVQNASAAVFRKSIYEEIGGADVSYTCSADNKLWIDIGLRGDIGYVSERLNYFRFHTQNVRSKHRIDGTYQVVRTLEHLLKTGNPNSAQKEKVRQVIFEKWMADLFGNKNLKLEIQRKFLNIIFKADPLFILKFFKKIKKSLLHG